MPTKDEHIDQTDHNRAFWAGYDLNSTEFVDWVVTGIFYESIHWIEAYLSTQGDHSGGHPDRLRNIRRHADDIGTIRSDYEVLKTESENARYLCYRHSSTDITNDLIPIIENIKTTINNALPA